MRLRNWDNRAWQAFIRFPTLTKFFVVVFGALVVGSFIESQRTRSEVTEIRTQVIRGTCSSGNSEACVRICRELELISDVRCHVNRDGEVEVVEEVVPGDGGRNEPPGQPGGQPPALPPNPPPQGGSPGLTENLCTVLNQLGLPVQVLC